MRIALATVGTTGDVRPFALLAEALTQAGHEVTAISWRLHAAAFEDTGAQFLVAGPATSWDDIRDAAQRATAARSPMDQVSVLRDFHLRDAAAHYAHLREALRGHDMVLLHGIHSLAEAAARDAGLRWASAVFDPVLLPTSRAAPAGLPNLGPLNRVSWWVLDRALRRLDRPLQAALTAAGSDSAGEVTMFRARSPLLHLVACSPSIVEVPADLPPNVRVTGAWQGKDQPPSLDPGLEAFLAAGEPPVVVSFGSMAAGDPAELSRTLSEALDLAGTRAVVQAGLAGLIAGGETGRIHLAGELDHRALFPRGAAVVHHGGAGTTHAAAAAGVPSVVVPHVGDQPYWATRLHRVGVAPAPLPGARLAAGALAKRIRQAVDDQAMRVRARALAGRLATEDGLAGAVGRLELLAPGTAG